MTIDRAIEILNPEHREHYDGLEEINEACRMGMEALERSRWIPCSERLPDDYGKYLVCVESAAFPGATNVTIWVYDGDGWKYEYVRVPNITHWQPLPEPPKEGGRL